MSLSIRKTTSSPSGTKKTSTQLSSGKDEIKLRLQLAKEIDKLALLMQEVRDQSARVQAAADAIGDKTLLAASSQPLPAGFDGNNRTGKLPSIAPQSLL